MTIKQLYDHAIALSDAFEPVQQLAAKVDAAQERVDNYCGKHINADLTLDYGTIPRISNGDLNHVRGIELNVKSSLPESIATKRTEGKGPRMQINLLPGFRPRSIDYTLSLGTDCLGDTEQYFSGALRELVASDDDVNTILNPELPVIERFNVVGNVLSTYFSGLDVAQGERELSELLLDAGKEDIERLQATRQEYDSLLASYDNPFDFSLEEVASLTEVLPVLADLEEKVLQYGEMDQQPWVMDALMPTLKSVPNGVGRVADLVAYTRRMKGLVHHNDAIGVLDRMQALYSHLSFLTRANELGVSFEQTAEAFRELRAQVQDE